MADMYAVSGETLTGIANAIRSKTGSDEQMPVSAMAAAIEGIPLGTDEGFFVPQTYCYGKIIYRGTGERYQHLYWSAPNLTTIDYLGRGGRGAGRNTFHAMGCLVFNGTGLNTYYREDYITGTLINSYTSSYTYVGVANEQNVFKNDFIVQAVNVGTNYLEFYFIMTIPVPSTNPLQYYNDNINLGEITPDTWINLGDHGKLYIGFNNPVE